MFVVTASAVVRISLGLKNNTRNGNRNDAIPFYYVTTGTGFVCRMTYDYAVWSIPLLFVQLYVMKYKEN